ncbi:DHH family phosphoesterase [Evansella cellulosilytica]|uniref:3'(2'),5'-bisphosphate nucleotidase n=1 Tax=Evansella cellulosilytica (strain ATCC 21833 / DSM 2522 / FERM P-1141 / JCM 9156 / N-4) TaxID=649639 RepID=E6U129_EVAC2|nr:bifunctional oligoribonuclease/PAP phosphatase NrnA [Evansella cellulosilytica]ADU31475.1 3'(2'),5'-bisphosphate nucleotidase [Evansella cellulosilytica DSM 2522]
MKDIIFEKIKEWDSIIIHRHVRPDPDAYGSQGALKELIKTHFPNKKVYIVGEHEKSLQFLTQMDNVTDETFARSLVIVCDTANRERIDDERYRNGAFLIKIDHHPEVDVYGDIAWVDETASSTSEMICELFIEFEKDGAQISEEAARLLYAGMIGDTGRFKFPNTTERTFMWAGKLIKKGFSREQLHDAMYETTLPILRLEGYVLSELKLRESGAGVVYLTKETLEKFQVTSKEAASIVNSFSTLKGIKAWVFFVEEEDIIRVRLRSKGPVINKLAERYHGGGHPLASGAQVKAWEETDEVIAELDSLCEAYE